MDNSSSTPGPATCAACGKQLLPDAKSALQNAMSAYKLARLSGKPEDGDFHRSEQAQPYLRVILACLGQLTPGAVDPWLGKTIETIIRKAAWFIVYIDDAGTVQWWSAYASKSAKLVADVQAEVSRLEHETGFLFHTSHKQAGYFKLPFIDSEYSVKRGKAIRCLLGEAIAVALSKGTEVECTKILRQAEEEVLIAKDQFCRPTFVGTALIPLLVFSLTYLVSTGYCMPENSCLPLPMIYRPWYQATLAGALGAFASTLFRSNKLVLEPSSGRIGIIFDALARVSIGAIAGFATTLAFDSGILLKEAIDQRAQEALRLLLCLVAGISERMLPSLVERAENIAGTGTSKKTE